MPSLDAVPGWHALCSSPSGSLGHGRRWVGFSAMEEPVSFDWGMQRASAAQPARSAGGSALGRSTCFISFRGGAISPIAPLFFCFSCPLRCPPIAAPGVRSLQRFSSRAPVPSWPLTSASCCTSPPRRSAGVGARRTLPSVTAGELESAGLEKQRRGDRWFSGEGKAK